MVQQLTEEQQKYEQAFNAMRPAAVQEQQVQQTGELAEAIG